MKKLLWILIIAPLLICGNCDRNDPPKPKPQLPPVTTTGEETFACKINGEVWTRHWLNPVSGSYDGSLNSLILFAENRPVDEAFRIELYDRVIGTGTYQLYDSTMFRTPVIFFAGKDSKKYYGDYRVDSLHRGTIKILRADVDSPYIIAGTFEFDAVNDSGEVVHITEGRFDHRYAY